MMRDPFLEYAMNSNNSTSKILKMILFKSEKMTWTNISQEKICRRPTRNDNCSVPIIIRKLPARTTVRDHLIPVKIAIIKQTLIFNAGETTEVNKWEWPQRKTVDLGLTYELRNSTTGHISRRNKAIIPKNYLYLKTHWSHNKQYI